MATSRSGVFWGALIWAVLIALVCWTYFSPKATPPKVPDIVATSPAENTTATQPETPTTMAQTESQALDNQEFIEIIPTGDGSAYLTAEEYRGSGKPPIWYLRGAEAVRVREVPRFTESATQPSTQATLLPALQQSLRKEKQLRRAAESKLEDEETKDAK